ncbi:MAG: threonylcarbamoyladenosine tRNA methylthiotransferase [Thermoplasmata archaeon]|nr:MAG: threonylcarbamoyladenosine tRNA methylthiotransferase [Thermoplasmata archaeon]
MKVCVETFGCTMNQGDSEAIKAIISREHTLCETPEICDVVVINSCGVIERTERNILKRIRTLKNLGKKVVVVGCLPRINLPILLENNVDAILSGRAQNSLSEVIKNLENGKRIIKIEEFPFDRSRKLRRKDSCIAIVNIAEGCLGNCSYCATRFARGRLKSRKLEEIIREIKECLNHGFKEIQITSQDNAAYGKDLSYRLPELLEEISSIEGKFRVRVGMMNPAHTLEILDELIQSYSNEKIYKFIHLPVQSGDNEILRHMNRGYTVEEFLEIVNTFRNKFKDLTFSTDIIVGYPTEDEDSFETTYEFIKKIKPDILNITRFSPRPNTPASRLKDLPDRIKKERSRLLTHLLKKIGEEKNRKLIGKKFEVLTVKPGKNGTLLSRTNSYRQVVLKNGKIGEFRKVKIKDATFSYLIGDDVA